MGNGSPHESCLAHSKVQSDIDKVCRETGECNEDRKEIWNGVNKKPDTKLMCWIIGIIISIFMAFMSTGFYVLSSQISAQTITTNRMSNKLVTVKTDTEVIKVQIGNLSSDVEKIDKRVERIEHKNTNIKK